MLFIFYSVLAIGQNEVFVKADSIRKAGNNVEYLKELYSLSSKLNERNQKTAILRLQVKLLDYYNQTNFNADSIKKYYKKGKELAKKFNNEGYSLNYDYMWADYLVTTGKYKEALLKFQELDKVLNEEEHQFLPNFYDAYARLLYFLNDYEESFAMLKKEAKIFEKRQNEENICRVYNNLGILYKARKQLDSSIYYHEKSQQINLKNKDTIGVIMSYNNMGLTYYQNEDGINAEKYYRLAFNYAPGKVTISLLNNYATLLLVKGNYKVAEKFLLEVKQKAESKRLEKDALTQLVTLHKLQKKFEKASRYQDTLSWVTEELLDEIKIKEIKRLQVEHETQKKEQQIKQLEEKTEAQLTIIKKNKLIASIVLVALLLTLVIFIMYLRNKINVDKLTRVQLQQKLLRSQMNPHFIFNALSNIQTDILKKENEKAVKYLAKFAKLLRYNLENTNLNNAIFSKEIQSIRDYLEMQKLRLNDNLQYTIQIDDTIEQDFIRIPAMILQPIVENAIEHGVENVEYPVISVDILDLDNKVKCVIKDNGIGYSISKQKKSKEKESFATSIIKKRLDLLTKKTKLPLQFLIEDITENDQIKGTKVVITLPIFNEN